MLVLGFQILLPNLCVNLTTASGPTLSISLADIVLMLASAFQGNHSYVFVVGVSSNLLLHGVLLAL
jgi:hypothetical protein